MSIKKIALVILLINITLFSGNAFSQQNDKLNKTPEEFAQKRADRMKKNLSLTDVQYKQVYDLFLSTAKEKKSNKDKYKELDKSSRKELKKQNRDKFNIQLKEILNKEQSEKLDQMKLQYKDKKKKGYEKRKNLNNPDGKGNKNDSNDKINED